MDRVRMAVLGAGRWGPNIIRNFYDDPRSDLVAVADLSEERLRLVQERFPDVKVTTSLEDLVDDPSIDAVAIATPATTHFAIASRLLAAGKHCLVEKPLAPSIDDARALVRQADEAGLVLAVGHVFLYNPSVLRIDRYVKDGTVGEVRYISMVRTNLGPPGIDVSVAWDLATHDVSIANYWLGTHAESVTAQGGRWISESLEDTIFATLTYPNGCLVHLNVSWLNPVKTRDITLVGSRKMITMDDTATDAPVRLFDKGIDPQGSAFIDSYGAFRAIVRDGDVTIPHVALAEPLREECGSFVNAVATGAPLVNSGESALPVVATIEAIERSLRLDGANVAVQW